MTAISPPDITVFNIADWFLARAKAENKPLKHMKLQKLVYFAYGWYFAYSEPQSLPLFKEKIYAWPHGPVVEDLYHKYKFCGSSPIDTAVIEPEGFDDIVRWVMEQVWRNFSRYSDTELSNETHRVNSPWYNVYDSLERDVEILPETIRAYFRELREKHAHARTR